MRDLPTNKDGSVKRTASERRGLYSLEQTLRMLERNLYDVWRYNEHIPDEWDEIVRMYDEEKERITMRVDKSALKFFRSMGPNYQVKINLVIRAFVQARAAGFLQTMEKEGRFWDVHFNEERMKAAEKGLTLHWHRGCDTDRGPFADPDAKAPLPGEED